MDPQTVNNLDPKLQATYDRVMGANTQPPAAQPAAAPVAAAPTPAGQPQPAAAATPSDQAANPAATPNQGLPTPSYAADTLSFQAAIQQPAAANPAPAPLAVPQQQASPLLRVLYIIGGVVFFVVYTIVWIKIFNLPNLLPF